MRSTAKPQIRMGSGSDKVKLGSGSLIDQNPIRFDVAITMFRPIAGQGVVAMLGFQGATIRQGDDDGLDFRQILPAGLLPQEIALEPGAWNHNEGRGWFLGFGLPLANHAQSPKSLNMASALS